MPITMIPVAKSPVGSAPITGVPTVRASRHATAAIRPLARPVRPMPCASSVSASEW